MTMQKIARSWVHVGAFGLLAMLGACGDSGSNTTPDARPVNIPDAAPGIDARPTIDAGPTIDAPPTADCFQGTPATNEDILNACTTAQRIPHNPTLPLINSDGTLPPHP